jgi:hypothetical protein
MESSCQTSLQNPFAGTPVIRQLKRLVHELLLFENGILLELVHRIKAQETTARQQVT